MSPRDDDLQCTFGKRGRKRFCETCFVEARCSGSVQNSCGINAKCLSCKAGVINKVFVK